MAMKTRMLPLGGAPRTGVVGPNNNALRSYTATAGQFIDALGDHGADAATLTSQGFILVGGSGVTADRPMSPVPGFTFIDTTLALAIVWDGAGWRDPVTGNAK